jgi:hypothetical protein
LILLVFNKSEFTDVATDRMIAKLKDKTENAKEFSVNQVISCADNDHACKGAAVETAWNHLANG